MIVGDGLVVFDCGGVVCVLVYCMLLPGFDLLFIAG